MPSRQILPTSWLLLLIVAIGCSGGKKTVKVEGVIKVDGKPEAGLQVKFVNQEKGGRDADGTTDENGVFHLSTFNTNDGAMPGSYKVTIAKFKTSEGSSSVVDPSRPDNVRKAMQGFAGNQGKGGGPPKTLLPEIYSNADSTPLKFQIPYDGKIEIEISSKGGK